MADQKSQNTHYVPEWLLKKFREPYFFELDIFTGRTQQRNPKTAASDIDLWPPDIEDGLSVYDNLAAQIYRRKIQGQSHVVLTAKEREDFSRWLAKFYIRSPKRRENAEQFLKEERQSGELVAKVLTERRNEYLTDFKTRNPDWYKKAVNHYGEQVVNSSIIERAVEYYRGREDVWPEVESVNHFYMRNNASERFAEIIRGYGWYWLRSPHGFVIGDNPLVVWHVESGRWDFGIEREGVQMTLPLGVNVCLLLTQFHVPYGDELMECSGPWTRQYNVRQRFAASQFVYGNRPELLQF